MDSNDKHLKAMSDGTMNRDSARTSQQRQRQQQGTRRVSRSEAARRVLQDRDAKYEEREQAVAQLEEGVRDGDAEAMWLLGVCCEHGVGTEQNLTRARELYQASQEKGCRTGAFFMECSNRNGLGSRKLDLKSLSSHEFRVLKLQTSTWLSDLPLTWKWFCVLADRQMQWRIKERLDLARL